MITSGDIQFEPPAKKIYQLTNSSVMLIAGDSAAQVEIYQAVRRAITARLAADQSWMTVNEIASLVGSETVMFMKRRVERTVLQPFALNFDQFIKRQREMTPEFYKSITTDIAKCRPDNQTIVAGVDEGGAHVYEVDAWGDASCSDAAGFAAIGMGYRHVESQFMFGKHAAWKPFPETLLLAYAAKKRAEVAPGVGSDTDMCYIKGLGGFFTVPEDSIKYLEFVYVDIQHKNNTVTDESNKRIAEDFRKVAEAAKAPAEAAAVVGEQGSAPPPPSPEVSGDEVADVVKAEPAKPSVSEKLDLSSSPTAAKPGRKDRKKRGPKT